MGHMDPEVELVLGRLCPIVGLIGLILNFLVVLIFSTSNFKEQVLYKYLKYEAVFICLDLLITVFKPMFYCSTCPVADQMPAQIYQVYFNIYGASVLEMSALMCRNFSALICYLLISSNLQLVSRSRFTRFLLDKRSSKLLLVAIILFSGAVYSYQLFELNIVSYQLENDTKTYARIDSTEFGMSETKKRLEIAATILRDCINLLILVVLNFLIIFQLRMNLKKKKKIIKFGINEMMSRVPIGDEGFSRNSGNAPCSRERGALRDIKRKENRQTVMVILTCLNYLLGRLPLLYLFVKRNLFTDTSNFGIYAILIAYISYTANFLFYYVSNYRFRASINVYLKRIFSICLR